MKVHSVVKHCKNNSCSRNTHAGHSHKFLLKPPHSRKLSQVKDALNQATSIDYDTSNRPIKVTDRKGQASQISYNERGQVSAITKPDQAIQYTYDALGRLTEVRDNATVSTQQYDDAGCLAARKVQAGTSADLITQRYGYDSLERLAQIKYIKAEATASEQLIEQIDYQYDSAGH